MFPSFRSTFLHAGSDGVIGASSAKAEQALGGEQGRVGGALSREPGWLLAPRQITLFWARRDDIMTDSDEDVGTRGRKPYLLQWHRGGE